MFRDEVQSGFHDLTGPKIEVRVKESVKDGQKFVNKVDVGGLAACTAANGSTTPMDGPP